MSEFFALQYAGPPFVLLGPAHLGVLGAILSFNLALIPLRRRSTRARTVARWSLALAIWLAESAWHIWKIAVGDWDARVMLPLNLCSVLIWLSGLMLVSRSRVIYDFAFFLGIGGAIQYLATPDLGIYGFPHFRFFQAYASHGLLLTAPVYMTLVEGFRPTWRSLRRVFVGANLYLVPIFFVNLALGSNFLMLNHKPESVSLLDLLPEWPYYIIFMELIGVATCLVLYLPFAISDARRKRPQLGA